MRSLLLLLVMALITGPTLQAQEKDPVLEKFANTITEADLEAHLTFLADDALEGRETGTRGQRLAAKYIRTHFMRLGLKPGNPSNGTYYQIYNLNRVEIKDATITVKNKSFKYQEDFFALQASLPDEIPGDYVFAGYGISNDDYNNLSGLDLKGKTAIMFVGSPKAEAMGLREQISDWFARVEIMESKGAAAVMAVLPDSVFSVLSRYAGRSSFGMEVESGSQNLAPIFVSEELGKNMFAAAKGKVAKIQAGLKSSPEVPKLNFSKMGLSYSADVEREKIPAENVLGFLEGSENKDEIVVLTAHYDHIGIARNGEVNNGADDDGSGTVTILELAEAFTEAAKAGHRPKRSIVFMTVSGEEKGLLGSKYYTDYDPVYPLENTVANLNIDMVGRIGNEYQDRPDSLKYVYLIGSDKLSTELHELSEEMNKTYTQLTLDYKYNDENDPNRFYYRSDHYNFAKNNIPIIFYFNGVHADYHRPTDTIEKIEFDKIERIGRLIFATAWEIANRENRLVVDKAN